MFRHLTRLSAIGNVRSFGLSKKLFASANVLAENKDPNELLKLNEYSKKTPKHKTVAAAFAALTENENEVQAPEKKSKYPNLDDIIINCKTVNGLLNIAETHKDITRKEALKIVSILAEWSSIDRVKLDEFENDARFTKLCRMLGRAVMNKKSTNGNTSNFNNNSSSNVVKKIGGFRTADMETVLGITGDDEAAKLVASISLDQMVKVLKTLAMKKRRSTPLLRSLAFNMSGKEEHLDVKQCSDILFAMSSLNFPEPVLISKVCEDIQLDLKRADITKSATIGSMLTSLAFLKYREPVVLDCLAEWIVKNQGICRTQDIAALCMTLATLNYIPTDLEDVIKTKIATSLTPLDFKNSSEYLTFVWSLMALNVPFEKAFDHVLQQSFIDKLLFDFMNEIPTPARIKLLNINAGVKLFLPTYKGAMLNREKHKDIYEVPLLHNYEKQLLVKAMIDAIKNIVPEACLRQNQDTSMGFVIDAEFYIDAKCNPIQSPTNDSKRIAIMMNSYHDLCQGPHQYLSGISTVYSRLLEKAGYHVISVPHYDFSANDLLLKRVQYLQKLIKEASKN